MSTYTKIFWTIATAFLACAVLVVLQFPFSNYVPIVYGLAFFPLLMLRMLRTTFESASYVKRNHPEFYEKYKTFTSSLDGKVVDFFSASNKELEHLNDPKVAILKNELKNTSGSWQ